MELFECKVKSDDYHDSYAMNANHYTSYMKNQLGPRLPDYCSLVLDQASYHLRKTGELLGLWGSVCRPSFCPPILANPCLNSSIDKNVKM